MEETDKPEEETEALLSSFPVFSWNILSPLNEHPKKSKVGNKYECYIEFAGNAFKNLRILLITASFVPITTSLKYQPLRQYTLS